MNDKQAPLRLELPRLVMARALAAAVAALALSVVVGFLRSGEDIAEETRAALVLTTALSRLAQAPQQDDAQVLQGLRELQLDQRLRHLAIQLSDSSGRPLLAPSPEATGHGWLEPVLALHRLWHEPGPGLQLSWPLPRPQGGAWTVTVTTSSESERLEGMSFLVEELASDAVGVFSILLVMAWTVRRSFQPLQALLQAIARIERDEPRAAESLPQMAVRELRLIVSALRQLHAARQQEQRRRRLLSHQVQTLQEDERQHLARELHDEFGQRLTALRADAAWLQQRLAGQAELQGVAQGMAEQCAVIQRDIRGLLARLQPLGPVHGEAGVGLARLADLLTELVAGWNRAPGTAMRVKLRLVQRDAQGRELPWPGVDDDLLLPRERVLALYRMSQEALTNVARHAQAQNAELALVLVREAQGLQLDWAVSDDGIGLARLDEAQPRGNGLAGLKERAWAQGGDLQWSPLHPGAVRPGLRLSARFDWTMQPAAANPRQENPG